MPPLLPLPRASVLLRLDGMSGDAAPLIDVLTAGLGVIARSRASHLLDLETVQQRRLRAPDQVSTHEDKWDDARPRPLPGSPLNANWPPGAPGGGHPRRHPLALHRRG